MNKYKMLITSMIGNILEFYDIGLIGFLGPLMAKLFFPTEDPLISIIASLGTFAIGFIARPIGALIFGHFGDILGRKRALLFSVVLMSIPTTLIGLLPTYEAIGVFAPTFLIICRFFQGICTGGEYNGSAIFFLEHYKNLSNKGFYSSLLAASSLLGFFLASIIAYLCINFSVSWRFPFFLGGVISLVGWYIRNHFSETPEFYSLQKTKNISTLPIKEVFTQEKIASFCMIGIGWAVGCLSLNLVGLNTFLIKTLLIPDKIATLTNMIGVFFYMLFTPFMGMLADKITAYSVMKISAWCSIILIYPIIYLLSMGTIINLLIGQIILALITAGFAGSFHLLTFYIFPARSRYTGIAFNYSLGLSIFGGCAPLFTTLLAQEYNKVIGPALYLIISSSVGLISLIITKRYNKNFNQTT